MEFKSTICNKKRSIFVSNANTFKSLALGKALANSLDQASNNIMISCINPLLRHENITESVIKYSFDFQLKPKQKKQLKSHDQLVMERLFEGVDKV